MRDLRYAFRSLARTPVFAVTAVVILSLSVGATTTVFTLLHALVLRPLPIENPHELARVLTVDRRGSEADLPWRLYREFAAHQKVFSVLIPSLDQSALTLESDRGFERGAVAGAAGNLYQEFGVTPALGRLIQPADVDMSVPTGAPVAVLGWNFWQRHFGADPNVVGRTIKAEGVPLTIIGVAPRDFLGFSISIEHDLTVPIGLLPSIMASEVSMIHGTSRWISTVGRLAPGVSIESARAQVAAMWPSLLDAATPERFLNTQREDYLKWTPRVSSGATGIERGLRNRYTNPLYALLGIAILVLVIAGANLCALVFARAEARRQELAVRLALGSSRARVIRELGVEGALLGIAGAIGGVTFAALASQAIIQFLMRDYVVRTSLNTAPDATVIAVTVLASAGVAIAVTIAAAANATRHGGLTSGASRTVARSSRAGRILVATQIAASIVMLAHASLLARSVYAISAVDSGLTDETVVVGSPSPRLGAYQRLDVGLYYRQALNRVMAVPGVTAAAFSTFKPEGGKLPLEPVGRAGTPREADGLQAEWPLVSPGLFDTLGISLLRGRDFSYADTGKSAKVAIISAHLERQLFGDGLGLGQRIRVSARPEWQDAEIVGIVGDARVFDVRSNNRAIVYGAAMQSGPGAHYKYLVARAPASAAPELRKAIESLGAEFMPRTQTLEYARGRTILQERLMAGLSGYFGVLGLVLVSAGIYGLLSYVLSLRRKEIGIRMALGADAARMTRSILRDGLMVTGIGIAIGLAGVVCSVALIRRLLVNTSPYDPIAIGMAGLLLLVVTSAASVVPAMRAGRVEPLAELRRD
jgi:putative ABC transport system permease protein